MIRAFLKRLFSRPGLPLPAVVIPPPSRTMPRVATNAFGDIIIEQLDTMPEPRFMEARRNTRWDYSTEEHYWDHPKRYPFEVFGGPHGGPEMPTPLPLKDWVSVWTDSPILPGYKLVMDDYSDRLYHVWKGEPK